MKLNFGHYVLFAYIIGASFILFIVCLSFKVDFEMAEENYYSKEMQMNHFLDGQQSSNHINGLITAKVTDDQLKIQFSDSLHKPFESGSILIYCPSSSKNDYKYILSSSDTSKVIDIPTLSLKRGANTIKVEIVTNNKYYYDELNITL
ncbi:MAG: FixH family protein [Saprospiraceae bacterium]|nr:FixH family protein [Saprospiraceae bacterium]MBK7812295.1 FixH family protein [Saprospiraceae bacterium]MBK9632484.1 FixH family protein [Saprospiraceae bacterium]